MKSYIVKQPIYNARLNAWAQEIMYSDASGAYVSSPAMEQFFLDYAATVKETDGKAFISMTYSMLEHRVADLFPPEKLVVQLSEDVLLMPETSALLSELHDRGCQIATLGFNFNARMLAIIGKINYIKLNFAHVQSSFQSVMEVARSLGKKIIAYNINDESSYAIARELGVDYMQGTHLAAMQPKVVHCAEHLPTNFAQLLVAVNSPDPDYQELEKIISRDVALTFSILKLVNSAYFAPRSRIGSIRQALSFLGVKQLKEWVYLLGFQGDGALPLEYMKLSLLRAMFCSEVQKLIPNFEISSSEAYLIGLLSTLDVLLGSSIEQILEEVDVSDAIADALLQKDTKGALLYQFVRCYELGDWNRAGAIAQALNLPDDSDMGEVYFRCESEVNKMWEGITAAGIQ